MPRSDNALRVPDTANLYPSYPYCVDKDTKTHAEIGAANTMGRTECKQCHSSGHRAGIPFLFPVRASVSGSRFSGGTALPPRSCNFLFPVCLFVCGPNVKVLDFSSDFVGHSSRAGILLHFSVKLLPKGISACRKLKQHFSCFYQCSSFVP